MITPNINPSIVALRTDYALHSLKESDVNVNPFEQFNTWMEQAISAQVNEANAMCLATLGADGFPQGRIVLLRGVVDGLFSFYTNYNSAKGRDLLKHPKASLTFFWPELERQVRIKGHVSKLSETASDAYFASRPRSSQIGAWASHQSERLESREELEQREQDLAKHYEGQTIPRPPHWGGFGVSPMSIEFWQGRPSRLHDRIVYQLNEGGNWELGRLSP